MAKYIQLTKGYCTLVDDEDFEELSKHLWSTLLPRTGGPYAARRDSQRRYILMHRQILGILDAGRSVEGDHINGDGLDNRRHNLRAVTHKQNIENRRYPNRDSSTGVLGVSVCSYTGKYRVTVAGKHVGRYATLEDAVSASREARARYYTHAPKDS